MNQGFSYPRINYCLERNSCVIIITEDGERWKINFYNHFLSFFSNFRHKIFVDRETSPHLSKIISYSSCSSVVNRDEEIYHYYVGEQLPIIGECKHIAGCVRGFTRVNYCVHAILPLPHSVLRKYISLLESFLALWSYYFSPIHCKHSSNRITIPPL